MDLGTALIWTVLAVPQIPAPCAHWVCTLKDEALTCACAPAPVVVPAPPVAAPDLLFPTILYIGAGSAEWTASASGCVGGCRTRSIVLPQVGSAKVAIPLGLAIDATTIWLCHDILGKKWPKVSQSILIGMTILRSVSAARHFDTARTRIKSTGGTP
jgi:hypothetical protein